LLKLICNKLKIGNVNVGDNFANYYVSSKNDILELIKIFDKFPLNTSKHLNYLAFKEGYQLYQNENKNKDILKNILTLKDSMNKKRVLFELPSNHSIKITPYWLLGFIEGEGYFSVAQTGYNRLEFGITQTLNELPVLESISNFY